jgi:hypothetical protein
LPSALGLACILCNIYSLKHQVCEGKKKKRTSLDSRRQLLSEYPDWQIYYKSKTKKKPENVTDSH